MSSPTGNDDFMPGYDEFDEANLHQHTQFLDLTNGEGGERPEDEEHYEEHEDDEEEGDEEDDGGGMLDSFMAATTTHASALSSMDSRTPGKVVEAGHEHTGRWTKEEHEAFLSALQTYGKEWKKVAAKVKTRTVVQTRTHAQKYFQKLQKAVEGGGESVDDIDMGVSLEAKKASSQKKKKPRGLASIASSSKQNRRGSSATLSAAQVISGLSSSQPSGIASYVSAVSNASPQQQQQYQQQPMAPVMELPTQPPRHGFSTSEATFAPAYPSAFGSGVASSDGWMKHAGVKIVAPDPHAALNRGDFPEPSPAATGKRKLAEIAAARMLAGVAGVARVTEDRDGAPTPPPMPENNSGGLNMKNAPAPPLLFGGGDAGGFASARKGLSLQIVNPDSLGINYEEQQRRRRGAGGDSPVTPWDGQLEALVSEKRAKSEEFKFDYGDEKASGQSDNGYGANVALHPVCGLGTNIERTKLHQAICDVDVVSLKTHLGVLANLSDGVLQRQDENGYCPLHTACAMTMAYPEKAAQVGEMVRMLLGAGADPTRGDNQGNTALHWASRSGDRHVTELLLLKNCPQDAKNSRGEAALHWAMRAGEHGMEVVSILLENGARPGVLSSEFRRPIDVAGEGFLDDPGSLATIKAKDSKQQRKTMSREYKKALKDTTTSRRDARANLLIRSAQSRTLVLHHPECLDHIPKSSSDWEAPDRITSIMRRVFPSSDPTGATETSGIFPHEVTVSKEFERAKLDLLSRIHSTEYLSFVNELSKDLEKQHKDAGGSLEESEHGFGPPPVVPFTPMVQRSMIKIAESRVKLGANSDTAFSAGSLRAARRATGAVQHAVDW
jgi:SHAQKYF class myb-like DNA-binding protein